jgi:hypothetical protein
VEISRFSKKNVMCVSCFSTHVTGNACLTLQLHTFQHSTCRNIQVFGSSNMQDLIWYGKLTCVQIPLWSHRMWGTPEGGIQESPQSWYGRFKSSNPSMWSARWL